MKYIKTPVYEFDELSEKAKEKVIDRERTFYFDCMFEDDLHLWLFDSDKCPLINSGVSIDSLRDLSYDLSNYQYDHVAADVNEDSNIDIYDVTMLIDIILNED